MRDTVQLERFKGRTPVRIDGGKTGDNELRFVFDDGGTATMTHHQDCCEHIWLEDVTGELADLIGSPLLMAEESCGGPETDGAYESQTWTFYRFATAKGFVTLRWIGESNGYYSESVDIEYKEA